MNILAFHYKNFKSYKEEYVLDFEAQESDFNEFENIVICKNKTGNDIRLLKIVSIYGANASGKSNVIWAIKAFKYFITQSRKFPVDYVMTHEPFLFSEDTRNEDTCMTMDFLVDGSCYRYSFSYNSLCFTSESLSIIDSDRNVMECLYSRENVHNIVIHHSLKNDIEAHAKKTLPNHLILSESATWESNGLQPIYSALATLHVEAINGNIDLKVNAMQVAENILYDDSTALTQRLARLMQSSDIGISSLHITRHGEKDFKFPDSMPEEIKKDIISKNQWEFTFGHKQKDGKTINLPIDKESTGTQHLFTLGSHILRILSTGGVLVIDEINLAIHSQLFKLLIRMFQDERSNPYGAQIVFTTHDTTILYDGMLRSDQVWFTEKNEYGESSLYSAQDFEGVSICVPFEQWYRAGRFGAIPDLKNLTFIFNDQREE